MVHGGTDISDLKLICPAMTPLHDIRGGTFSLVGMVDGRKKAPFLDKGLYRSCEFEEKKKTLKFSLVFSNFFVLPT